jgi:anti-sigma-K factor RskA
MAGILSPLLIGELVKDADKRWRWIRISAAATALVSEGLYAHRVNQRRQEQPERCR